jgi:hypothetical protein
MTSGRHIDYDALAQEALRGVVRAVLQKVAMTGLLGDHHFYIAFNTQAPGVNISRRLKERYPVEMTIVLQHRFWGLEVSEDKFEVKLTFDGIPERLVVPFKAVKVFYDPSVPYGLPFEESELLGDASRRASGASAGQGDDGGSDINQDDTPREARGTPAPERAERRPKPSRKARSEAKSGAGDEAAKDGKPAEVELAAAPQKPQIAAVKSDEPPKPDAGGAKVFDLSKFRKK